jgi:hypothetical protein
MRKAAVIAWVVMASVVLVPITQAADEKMTGRIVLHYNKTESIEVGDVPGHILGVSQQTGLIFYSTGEIAKKQPPSTSIC